MPITNLTNICGNGLLNLPAIKRGQILCPVSAVERAVLDGFGDVFGFDVGGVFDIGDGAGDFQDAVVGAGAKSLLSHTRPRFAAIKTLTRTHEFASG